MFGNPPFPGWSRCPRFMVSKLLLSFTLVCGVTKSTCFYFFSLTRDLNPNVYGCFGLVATKTVLRVNRWARSDHRRRL